MKTSENKLGYNGFSLVQNNGSIQEIKHYHFHVKSHYNNKNLSISFLFYHGKISIYTVLFTDSNFLGLYKLNCLLI